MASSEWVVVEELDKLHADAQTTLTMVGGEAAHLISPLPASNFECDGARIPRPPSVAPRVDFSVSHRYPSILSIHPHVHRQTYQTLRLHLNEFLATLQDDHDGHHDVSESIVGSHLLVPTSEIRPAGWLFRPTTHFAQAEVRQSEQPSLGSIHSIRRIA